MPRIVSLHLTVSTIALAMVFTSTRAHAQAMDYGALQDLYGEPVTTSATGTPQRASDVAANMTIITADQIKQAGTRSIPQIIGMYVPGIDVLQSANGGYDVGVRGYQQPFQPRILVLIDGRQVFVDDYSRTIWNNLPVNIDDIRQIEVVKGASSALFGSNAASGAINIVTYSPTYDRDRVMNISGGTQGTVSTDVTATYNGAWGGTKISAGAQNSDAFASAIGAFDVPSISPRRRYVSDASVFQITPELHLNLEGNYARSEEDIAIPTDNLVQESTRSYSVRGGFDWATPLGTIISDSYYNHDAVILFSGSSVYLNTDLLVSKLEDRFTLGSEHTFRVTAEYRNKQFGFNSNTVPGQSLAGFGKLNEDSFSFGGSWLWQLSDSVSLTNALTGDHQTMAQNGVLPPGGFYSLADYNHTIDSWSANSGLVYKFAPTDTMRLTYGRGIILPSLLESGFVGGASLGRIRGISTFADILGNPFLSPTVVQSLEAALDHRFESLGSTLTGSAFYGYNREILGSPVPTGAPHFLNRSLYLLNSPINPGSSRSLGGELQFKGQSANGLHWDASYSYVHVDDSAGVKANLDYTGSSPAHHVRLSGGYTTGPWSFDANIQYLSSTDAFRANGLRVAAPMHIDGYVTVGGRIAYDFGNHFTLALEGSQLNDQRLQTTAYPQTERQLFGSLTAKF